MTHDERSDDDAQKRFDDGLDRIGDGFSHCLMRVSGGILEFEGALRILMVIHVFIVSHDNRGGVKITLEPIFSVEGSTSTVRSV